MFSVPKELKTFGNLDHLAPEMTPDVEANFPSGQTVELHHQMVALSPKRLFPIYLHGEREVYNSVDNLF